MRILWHIHLYPPHHNCGAEYMAHSLNKFLIKQGHTVKVLLRQAQRNNPVRLYDIDGVVVFPANTKPEMLYRSSDVVFTHLDYSHEAVQLATKYRKPVYHFVHNDIPYQTVLNNPQLNVVYNSEWIKEKLNYPNKSFVMPPPCDWRFYDVVESPEQSEYITLINLDDNKGGWILAEIASRLPDKKFLAVRGSYSATDDGQHTNFPPNVTVLENTPNILNVYRQTRVLLMPSKYESWGRTATEAFCNGIPVISTETPGLKENCGSAGIYIKNREDLAEWVKAIKALDDPKKYAKQSEKVRARSRELDPVKNMEDFEIWLRSTSLTHL